MTGPQTGSILLVESFNNEAKPVAIVNFSVPDDVKRAFDRAFKNRNKSALIAELMRRAVADAELAKQRAEIFRKITEGRARRPSVSNEQIRSARDAERS